MSKKLLLIIPLFPKSISDDTIVPFIAQFIDYFSEKNPAIQIHILTLNYPFTASTYKYKNLKIHALGTGFKKDIFIVFKILKNVIRAISLNKKHRFNGILSFWYGQTAIIGKIIHFWFKTPHYTWLQGQDAKPENKYIKWLRPNPERLIMVGKKHQEVLFKSHQILAKHVANVAVNPEAFPKLNQSNRSIDIIGIGNLGKLKNYSLFIDLIFDLKRYNPTIKAIICGDGDQRESLTAKIKTLNLNNNIELLGYVSNLKTRELMNNSKIMLHTSTFEGNSFAIQEALYSGCKVVSTFNCFEKEVSNFYHKKNKNSIISKLDFLLKNLKKAERVMPYNIEKTEDTIYKLFFSSEDEKAK